MNRGELVLKDEPAPQPSPAAPVNGKPAVDQAVLREGERRIATVVMADIYGSTNLLEKIGNEAWVDLMNRVLSSLEGEVYRFGGLVDQFRGDGLVAFFGTEIASEDDPERAVLAALAMQQRITVIARELPGESGRGLRLRVGVNTGEVIVASIGDRHQHWEDTAMGIAITIASRMETAAEPGTVLVSEYTYHQIESKFVWQPLGEISVKGLSQPLAGYRPITSSADAERLTDLEVFGYPVPLIGREVEFKLIKEKIHSLQEGQGNIVLVSGETGIGKHGLIREMRQYILRQDALLADMQGQNHLQEGAIVWLYSRGKSYDWNWPYSLWIDVIKNWLDVYPGQNPEEVRAKLRQESETLWGERLAEFYPYLATMLELPLEEDYSDRVKYLDGEGLRFQFLLAIRGWLDELVARQPVVVAFTGMEWSDPSSVEMVKYCIPLVENRPILWIMAFRPEKMTPVWDLQSSLEKEFSQYLTLVDLKPLTAEQCEKMIHQLVGVDTLPKETVQFIVENAEGKPAYIIEMFRSLIEKQILVQDHETSGWRLSRAITSVDMPPNLQRLLQARFDRLQDEERFILQMAAVVGPVFWTKVLQSLAGENTSIRDHLINLQHAQLIERTGRVPDLGVSYSFRTNLIREAAYESLLNNQREAYHLKVAQILEDLIDLRVRGQYQALIAFHYRRGGDKRKELFYTMWAAEKAREFYASTEVIEHYSRAIELLDEMIATATDPNQLRALNTQKFEVLSGRYSEYYHLGDVNEGNEDAKALLELSRQISDEPTWLIDALLRQPEVTLADQIEYLDPGLAMAEQALDLARKIGDRHRQLFALIARAKLLQVRGDQNSLDSANEALALARELGDLETETRLLIGIASGYGMENIQQSKELLDQAVLLSKRLNNKRIELELLSALGAEYERNGDYYHLLTQFEEKRLAICREIGDKLTEGFVLMYVAQIQGLYLGDYDSALKTINDAFKLTKKVTGSLYPLLRLVQLQTRMGLLKEASDGLEMAFPMSERGAFDIGRAGYNLVGAILHNEKGDEAGYQEALRFSAAVRDLSEGRKISRQYLIAANCEAGAAHLGLARLVQNQAEREKQQQEALHCSEDAYRVYQEYGFIQIIECSTEEVSFRRGQAFAQSGQKEEAVEFFNKAYDEMMRKHDLIPSGSHYRKTYLHNILLHRLIKETRSGS